MNKPANHCSPWTNRELELLHQGVADKKPLSEIARTLHRTEHAVRQRLVMERRKAGKKLIPKRRWKEQLAKLDDLLERGFFIPQIAKALDRTEAAVHRQIALRDKDPDMPPKRGRPPKYEGINVPYWRELIANGWTHQRIANVTGFPKYVISKALAKDLLEGRD